MLRVIREVLFFEPRRRGTDLNGALEFLMRVTPHRAIAVVISDFIGSPAVPAGRRRDRLRPQMMLLESLAQASLTMLRQANRRHDVVAVQIADRYELELPALGRLVLNDAETGEVVEINTGDERKRAAFAERQARAQAELAGCSVPPALTPSACAPTSLTGWNWAGSSKPARSGDCEDEHKSKV